MIGQNVVGRLPMDLCKKLREELSAVFNDKPLQIPKFCLLDIAIAEITLPRALEMRAAGKRKVCNYDEPVQRAFR